MSATTITGEPTPVAGPGVVGPPVVKEIARQRNILVWLSSAWLLLILLAAACASFLPIADYAVAVGFPRAAPSGNIDQLLGLDSQGRSTLSRVIYGARVSLLVAVVAGTAAAVIGTILGLLAGYFRGTTDTIIMYFADALLAFPPLVLLLAISSILQPSLTTLILGLTTLVVPTFTRLSRANTLNWASREFVLAARNMGWGRFRIAFREVLPNVLPSVLAYFPTIIAALIVAEGSLSFLGMGLPPPTPSWGSMISDGKGFLQTDPLLVFVPAAFIFLTIFALNQCGDYARNRFDRVSQR